MQLEIRHETDASRFVVAVEGGDCVLDYLLADSVMTITHTGVPAAIGGRGIAAALTQAALAAARENGWKVIPACSYARVYFARHPQQQDLLLNRET